MSVHELNPGGGKAKDMNPQERRVWLASHNAPEQYMLLTVDEMVILKAGVDRANETSDAYGRTFKRCEKLLLEYWKTEPDLPNGIAAAVFDAGKYTKLAKLLPPHLRKLRDKFKAVRHIVDPHVGDATRNELAELGEGLVEILDLLESQAALRRDRKTTT